MRSLWSGVGVLFVLAAAQLVCASSLVVVDENGNGIGTTGGGVLADDPGPGGLAGVLTYTLPFNPTPGDVHLTEASAPPPASHRTVLPFSLTTNVVIGIVT